jgi:hypothetical protein
MEVTMRTERTRRRSTSIRVLIVCIAALLALPAVASATYPFGASPGGVRHENGAADVALPQAAATAPRSVIIHRGDSTLPTILAAVALGVALTGTAYVVVRLRSLPRSA